MDNIQIMNNVSGLVNACYRQYVTNVFILVSNYSQASVYMCVYMLTFSS